MIKKLVLILVIGSSALPASSQTCSPTFAEVHAFEVGDLFQVKMSTWSVGRAVVAIGIPGNDTTWKYSIASKQIRGDTLLYVRKGMKRWNKWVRFDTMTTTIPLGILDFQDTAAYHSPQVAGFDRCPEDMVSMPGYLLTDSGYASGFMTRIRLAAAPLADFPLVRSGTRFKVFGGDSNLYYSDGRTLATEMTANPATGGYQAYGGKSLFAEGLGLVYARSTYSEFATSRSKEFSLMGHVRSGVAMGTIETDAVFREMAAAIRTSGRTEVKGRTQGWNFLPGIGEARHSGSPWSFDLSGRRLKPD